VKKTIVLLIVFFALSTLNMQRVSAQTSTKTTGWYMETTRFTQLKPADSISATVVNRHDKAGRLILNLTYTPKDRVNIILYDYDSGGGLRRKSTHSLSKDPVFPDRYNASGLYEEKEFLSFTQAVLDRLDNK
jgi:hypothetical protein